MKTKPAPPNGGAATRPPTSVPTTYLVTSLLDGVYGRVVKFTNVKEIKAKAATIKAYVREAIAVEKAGLRVERKKTSDSPVPPELTQRMRRDARFKRAFETKRKRHWFQLQ